MFCIGQLRHILYFVVSCLVLIIICIETQRSEWISTTEHWAQQNVKSLSTLYDIKDGYFYICAANDNYEGLVAGLTVEHAQVPLGVKRLRFIWGVVWGHNSYVWVSLHWGWVLCHVIWQVTGGRCQMSHSCHCHQYKGCPIFDVKYSSLEVEITRVKGKRGW